MVKIYPVLNLFETGFIDLRYLNMPIFADETTIKVDIIMLMYVTSL